MNHYFRLEESDLARFFSGKGLRVSTKIEKAGTFYAAEDYHQVVFSYFLSDSV